MLWEGPIFTLYTLTNTCFLICFLILTSKTSLAGSVTAKSRYQISCLGQWKVLISLRSFSSFLWSKALLLEVFCINYVDFERNLGILKIAGWYKFLPLFHQIRKIQILGIKLSYDGLLFCMNCIENKCKNLWDFIKCLSWMSPLLLLEYRVITWFLKRCVDIRVTSSEY